MGQSVAGCGGRWDVCQCEHGEGMCPCDPVLRLGIMSLLWGILTMKKLDYGSDPCSWRRSRMAQMWEQGIMSSSQCLTLMAWAQFRIQVSETASFLSDAGFCVAFFWEPGHEKLGISGKNSPCVVLAKEDWFGQWNVDSSWDLLPARIKNPVAASEENPRKPDGAANLPVRTEVQKWWFHLITSHVITGSNEVGVGLDSSSLVRNVEHSALQDGIVPMLNGKDPAEFMGPWFHPVFHPISPFPLPTHLLFIPEVLSQKIAPNSNFPGMGTPQCCSQRWDLPLPSAVQLWWLNSNRNEKSNVISLACANHSQRSPRK